MKIKSWGVSYVIFGLLLALTHYLLGIWPTKLLLTTHIFLFSLSLIVLASIQFIGIRMPDKIGYSFLAFVLVKMGISLVFLSTTIMNVSLIEGALTVKAQLIHFFIIYFLYLCFEVVLTKKLLDKLNM